MGECFHVPIRYDHRRDDIRFLDAKPRSSPAVAATRLGAGRVLFHHNRMNISIALAYPTVDSLKAAAQNDSPLARGYCYRASPSSQAAAHSNYADLIRDDRACLPSLYGW